MKTVDIMDVKAAVKRGELLAEIFYNYNGQTACITLADTQTTERVIIGEVPWRGEQNG